MFTFKTCLVVAGLVPLCMPGVAVAHPFHISSAEIEYDSGVDRLQVSLKLQAVDMERALAKLAGKPIKLEQAEVDEWLVKYLDRHFYLKQTPPTDTADNLQVERPSEKQPPVQDAEGDSNQGTQTKELPPRSQVHWVGSELKGAWMWLYFELELPTARNDLQLVNTVLFDTNTGQINTVSVRHTGQRTTLKLTTQQPSEKFPAQWMTP